MYEICADYQSNNQRIKEISKLIFEIMNLKFGGRRLVAKRFGYHSNSCGTDEIKGMPISTDFHT